MRNRRLESRLDIEEAMTEAERVAGDAAASNRAMEETLADLAVIEAKAVEFGVPLGDRPASARSRLRARLGHDGTAEPGERG